MDFIVGAISFAVLVLMVPAAMAVSLMAAMVISVIGDAFTRRP